MSAQLNWKHMPPNDEFFVVVAYAQGSRGVNGEYKIYGSWPTNISGKRNGPDYFDVRYRKSKYSDDRFFKSAATLESAKALAEADNERRKSLLGQ
jgi:hypothetical protein